MLENQVIESKMKRLLTAPPKCPLPSTEKILMNVPWIAENHDLVKFIKVHFKKMYFYCPRLLPSHSAVPCVVLCCQLYLNVTV